MALPELPEWMLKVMDDRHGHEDHGAQIVEFSVSDDTDDPHILLYHHSNGRFFSFQKEGPGGRIKKGNCFLLPDDLDGLVFSGSIERAINMGREYSVLVISRQDFESFAEVTSLCMVQDGGPT